MEGAKALVERLVTVAARPVEKAWAHWFAALVEERAGSALAADAHIHLASFEGLAWGPLVDPAGRYESLKRPGSGDCSRVPRVSRGQLA